MHFNWLSKLLSATVLLWKGHAFYLGFDLRLNYLCFWNACGERWQVKHWWKYILFLKCPDPVKHLLFIVSLCRDNKAFYSFQPHDNLGWFNSQNSTRLRFWCHCDINKHTAKGNKASIFLSPLHQRYNKLQLLIPNLTADTVKQNNTESYQLLSTAKVNPFLI